MKNLKRLLLAALVIFSASPAVFAQKNKKANKADVNSYGYYKDIFMDSGINLTSRRDLPVARFLGLSMDAFVSAVHSPESKLTLRDTVIQNEMICGNAEDFAGSDPLPGKGPTVNPASE